MRTTKYILSLSYGKDSLACLEACRQLGYPIDRIIHAEVWATDTIPADLPPMVEFKAKADAIIKERYGLTVEHICATVKRERERERERNSLTKDNSIQNVIVNDLENNAMVFLSDSIRGVSIDSKTEPLTSCEKLTYEKIFYRPMKRRAVERERERIYGFPILRGNWCTSNLKQQALRLGGVSIAPGNSRNKPLRISNLSSPGELVYQTQTAGFLIAPLHKVRIQILCSTSA